MKLTPKNDAGCEFLDLKMASSEDVQVYQDGLVFVSAGNLWDVIAHGHNTGDIPGEILVVDVHKKTHQVLRYVSLNIYLLF